MRSPPPLTTAGVLRARIRWGPLSWKSRDQRTRNMFSQIIVYPASAALRDPAFLALWAVLVHSPSFSTPSSSTKSGIIDLKRWIRLLTVTFWPVFRPNTNFIVDWELNIKTQSPPPPPPPPRAEWCTSTASNAGQCSLCPSGRHSSSVSVAASLYKAASELSNNDNHNTDSYSHWKQHHLHHGNQQPGLA